MDFFNKLKSAITNYENKKTIVDFHPGYLIGLFLTGFIGLVLIATMVQYALILPLGDTLFNSEFVNSLDSIIEGSSNVFLNFLDSVALFTYYFIAFIIFIILIFINKKALKWLYASIHKNAIVEGLAIGLIMLCCTIALGLIISLLPTDTSSNNNQQGIENAFSAAPLLSFFSIVIFAPVCEELTYRVGLFGLIAKKSKILAYVITILVFAFIHFDFEAENIINELINLPVYLVGAGFLCYAYARKGNPITSIVAHSTYNGIQFIMMLLPMIIK